MADGQRVAVGGWIIREDWRLPWNVGLSDPDVRLCVCGEIGHARWLLFIAANREAARRHLDTLLVEMAQRVGIEYSPERRRRETPSNDDNDDNASLWRQP